MDVYVDIKVYTKVADPDVMDYKTMVGSNDVY